MLCDAFYLITFSVLWTHHLDGSPPFPSCHPCYHDPTIQQTLVFRCRFAVWTPVVCLKGILRCVKGIRQVRSMVAVCAECAGINTAIYSPSGANSGVGFAIPVDIVRSSVDQIIRFGRVIRPILGISFAPDQSSEQASVTGMHDASCSPCRQASCLSA